MNENNGRPKEIFHKLITFIGRQNDNKNILVSDPPSMPAQLLMLHRDLKWGGRFSDP